MQIETSHLQAHAAYISMQLIVERDNVWGSMALTHAIMFTAGVTIDTPS